MTTTAIAPWGAGGTDDTNRPMPWSAQGKAMAHITKKSQIDAYSALTQAQLDDFKASLHKRYTENRMTDAHDLLGYARQLAGGDQFMLDGLMALVGQWMQTEMRVMRGMGSKPLGF